MSPCSIIHQGRIGWTWVRVHTDQGIVGTGETYPAPDAEIPIVLRFHAPMLPGRQCP